MRLPQPRALEVGAPLMPRARLLAAIVLAPVSPRSAAPAGGSGAAEGMHVAVVVAAELAPAAVAEAAAAAATVIVMVALQGQERRP